MVFTFFNKNNSYAVAVMLYELCFNIEEKKKVLQQCVRGISLHKHVLFISHYFASYFYYKIFFYYYYIKRNIAFDHQSTYFIRLNEISELSTFGQGQWKQNNHICIAAHSFSCIFSPALLLTVYKLYNSRTIFM